MLNLPVSAGFRSAIRLVASLTVNGGSVNVIVCCCLSFLIGGIPFGYLLGRFLLNDDIRNHGSGNIGATNVARVVGWKWGGFVLVLDALKGLLPTWAAMAFADRNLTESMHWHLPVAAGMSAIIGHMYPLYLKLRGGKGVATALGVVLVLAPKAVAVAFVIFAVVAGLTKVVALASILAAVVFGITQIYLIRDRALLPETLSLTAFAIGVPLLIIWRHRSNIVRLIKGTEAPLTDGAKEDSSLPKSEDASGESSAH